MQLEFFAYDVTPHPFLPDTTPADLLESLYFKIPSPSTAVTASAASDLTSIHSSLDLGRAGMDFEIDGVVYKLASPSLRSRVGGRTRSPRWAIAHKFEAAKADTELLRVAARVGRTGAITPVAELEPCDVGGVTVGSASLHNFVRAGELLRGAGKGAVVEVRRAGDVIPQVVAVVSPGDGEGEVDGFEPPKKCPACGADTMFEWEKGGEEDGAESGQVLRCTGGRFDCEPQVSERGAERSETQRKRCSQCWNCVEAISSDVAYEVSALNTNPPQTCVHSL